MATTKECFCEHCKQHITATIHAQKNSSGGMAYAYVCNGCRRLDPTKKRLYIPAHEVESKLTADELNDLPILGPDLYNRCAKCGSRDVQLHHWAPRAMFGPDCDSWPKDYLCPKHHLEWHKRVTPQLVNPNGH